jgi:hypothetical protein
MEDKTTFELANRLNQIMIERNKLDMEHNAIVEELKKRFPSLKDDENLKLIKIKEGGK